MLEQPDGAAKGSLPEPRPLARILAFEDEDSRFPRMDETWLTFAADMGAQVREVLDGGRSPAERAYGVGVIVHNYFRTRGITLTSYELRALAGELVELQQAPPSPVVNKEEEAETADAAAELVSFAAKEEATERAWAGDVPTASPPAVADTVFAPPPSTLVNVVGREAASLDRLLMKVVEIAAPSVGSAPLDRGLARATIDRTIDEVLRRQEATLSAEMRQRLSLMAFREICGLEIGRAHV